MEVEHSRLLKFFKETRFKSEMAEAPAIKIQKVFENPPNVEAEVPGTQEIREVDGNDKNNSQQGDEINSSEIKISGSEFTLSPVITVTKKESSLTKGDMKLQKVTVTEDIAMEDSDNGGYRISQKSRESHSRTHRQASSSTVVTSRRTEKRIIEGDTEGEKSQDEKKSKIPIMRLRQAAEKVRQDRRDQKAREQSRRSSIPKLKDAKKTVRKDTTLTIEPRVEDEFEKIYEEIAKNKQKEIDEIEIDETEKVESKFEELVQSYDEDEQEKHTVSRVSKIPALRRRDDDRPSRIGALIDRVKEKNTVTETKFKDGGFKVTSSTIRTKRFSRGNSRDLSREENIVNVTETMDIKECGDNEVFIKETIKQTPVKPVRSIRSVSKTLSSTHKGEIIETTQYGGSERVFKETIVKEHVTKGTPVNTKKNTRVTSREIKSHGGNNDSLNEKFDDIKNDSNDGTVTVEEFEDEDGGKRIITTKTIYSHSLPGKPDVTETVTIEELEDGGSLTTTTKTHVGYTEELSTPVITESISRSVSRETSTDDQNVEIVEINNSSNNGIVTFEETDSVGSNKIKKEATVQENVNQGNVKSERFTRGISREMGNFKQTENKETVTRQAVKTNVNMEFTKNTITKENIKEALPVKTERIHYGINQVAKESQNIVKQNVTSTKETKRSASQQFSRETLVTESTTEGTSTQITDHNNKETVKPEDNKHEIKKETMKIEQIEKEGIRIGIPAFTKVTESFSKGRIQSVEMSRSIEWKPADEIKTKHYSRSISEKVTKKELKDSGKAAFEAPVIITKIPDISNETNVTKQTVTKRATSTQDQKSKDLILEKQTKNNVKDDASTITIKKVAEYKNQAQVSNVEESTYSLRKTVDLTVDSDLERSNEVIQDQVNSKFEKENNVKHVSVEYSTEKNRESIITDTVSEKKETKYSNLSIQEKAVDTEEVTILKGNVSRLKNKITKENVVVSKKETDEDLPKKQSILSKIAVFERLEPKEAYPVIKRPTDKKTCKYVPNESTEQKPKIVEELLKEQLQLDSLSDKNNVEISSNYDQVTYVNEPVIVETFWKAEEGYGQNVSATNRVITGKATILETHQTINEAKNWEAAKILPGILDFKLNESQTEMARTVPAQVEFQDYETKLKETTSTLPGKMDFDPHQTTAKKAVDDKINKTDQKRLDYEAKISKTRPGKLNLNIWKNQVEANKTLVDKIDVIKGENIKEIAKTLPGKARVKSQVPVSKVLPENIDIKKGGDQYHVAQIIPDKIDFDIQEIQFQDTTTSQEKRNHKSDDRFNQIGMTLRDQNNLKAHVFEKNEKRTEILKTASSFEAKVNQSEIIKPSQNKIDNTSDSNQIELPKILPDKQDYLKSERINIRASEIASEVNKSSPGKINLNIWKNQVEVNKTHIGKIGINKSREEVEITKSISSSANFKTYEKQVVTSNTVQEQKEINKQKNQHETAYLPAQNLSANGNQNKAENKSFSTEDYDVEIVKLLPGFIDSNRTDTETEAFRTLPAKLDSKTTENQNEEPKTMPDKIEFETYESKISQLAVSKTLQSNIQFSTTENQKEEAESTMPGKLEFKTDENKVEVAKPLPGKLNLKAWENEVEVNKTLVDKIDVVRSENQEEIAKTLSGRIEFTTHENDVEDPKSLPGRIDINTYENKVQITKTSQPQINSESYQNKGEVATILQDQLEFKTSQAKSDHNTESNKVVIASDPSPTESLSDPELVDEDPDPEPIKFNKESVIESIKRKMYFITNVNNIQNSVNNLVKTESSEGSDSRELYENKVEELQTKTYSIANISQNTVNQTSTVEQTITTENSATRKNMSVQKTENIEERHEADTNSKNVSTKEYELNNYSNTSQNTITTSTTEVYSTEHSTNTNVHSVKSESVERNENGFNFKTNNVHNELTRSAYGAEDFKNREEIKRAKSLAELDLGDVIHGQVRRMVGRMKSVDYSRRESVKTEKISIKEMPKKMSVLEKIALFEGKTSPSRIETTTFRPRTTKRNVTKALSEEEYLQKIEELRTARARLGTLDEMLYLPLRNGLEMPVIALGTALTDSRLVPNVIGAAIDLGYRAIDTAYIYGNEKEVGQAIRAKIDDGTVKREDLFIMSKLWSTFHRPDLVEEACKSSLNNMGLDYFDLYMIHNPMSFKEGPDPIPKIATVLQFSEYDYLDAWFGMETLVTKGLAKSIGVSNFNSQQIQRILDKGKLKPVVNQVECHPYLSQQRLDAFCKERNIILSCFGVLGSKGTPAEYKSAVPPVIDDPLVQVMASGLNVTPAQLLIRYQIECGHNVVVKCSTAAHLWDNLQALTFTLDQAKVDALHALNRNKRMFTFKGMGDTHKNYPFLAGF